ncbi:hypothetical protein CCUS01_13890 [Colletotrichum cuscutae]|nr:hypothetical protein CCUS01_13890 [Colletotrichum cuscutae]
MAEFAGCVCLFVRLRTLDKERLACHQVASTVDQRWRDWLADHRWTQKRWMGDTGGNRPVGRIPIVLPHASHASNGVSASKERPPPCSVCFRSVMKILDNLTLISMVGGMLLREGGFIDDGRGRRTRPSMRARHFVLAYIIKIRHRRPRGRAILCSAIS